MLFKPVWSNPKPDGPHRNGLAAGSAPGGQCNVLLNLLAMLLLFMSLPQSATAAGHVFWIDYINQGVYRSGLDGNNPTKIVSQTSGNHLAVDTVGEKIYWSNGPYLMRANYDGTQREIFQQGLDARFFRGLDFDGTTGMLYYAFTSGSIGEVSRINRDGTNYQMLATGGHWFDIILNQTDSIMVLSTHGLSGIGPRIYRGSLDGAPLFANSFPDTGGFQRLALHEESDTLFWTQSSQIWRSNLDGTGAAAILGRAEDIQVFGDKLYYTELVSQTRVDIWRANLDGTSPELVVPGARSITAIAVTPEPSQVCVLIVFSLFLKRRRYDRELPDGHSGAPRIATTNVRRNG